MSVIYQKDLNIKDEVSPCNKLKNWNWKEGQVFKDDSIKFGYYDINGNVIIGNEFQRNYFDCGMYYFDGVFNVVKFSKGMTLYHGSGLLANNVVLFPVGKEYYDAYDLTGRKKSPYINTQNLLTVAVSSDESIEEIISQNIPITAGWYADIGTAKIYSQSVNPVVNKAQNIANNCKDNCVFAYRLKEDIIMFLLDDDYKIKYKNI